MIAGEAVLNSIFYSQTIVKEVDILSMDDTLSQHSAEPVPTAHSPVKVYKASISEGESSTRPEEVPRRKRGRPPKKTTTESPPTLTKAFDDERVQSIGSSLSDSEKSTNTKKRGRPRKESTRERSSSLSDSENTTQQTRKPRRGFSQSKRSESKSKRDARTDSVSSDSEENESSTLSKRGLRKQVDNPDEQDSEAFVILPGRKRKVTVSSLNIRDRSGRTLLFKYAAEGNTETVQELLKAGVKVNITDYAGWSPLHEACVGGHIDTIQLLLQSGADVNVKGGNSDTPLHDAVSNGDLAVIDLLLSYGASLDSTNQDNETPLDLVEEGESEIQELLTRWKSMSEKVMERDSGGRTMLHRAVTKGWLKDVQEVLKFGSDVNARDNSGWTPLHEASLKGYTDICSFLLSFGAQVDAQGVDLDTPLHEAAANSFPEVVNLLRRYGATTHVKDIHGRSPLDLASCPRVKSLLEAPASEFEPFMRPTHVPKVVEATVAQPLDLPSEQDEEEDAGIESQRTQSMDWTATSSAQSLTEQKSGKKVHNNNFAWGGLENRPGPFESSREERKFQALLKTLAEAETHTSPVKEEEIKRTRKVTEDGSTTLESVPELAVKSTRSPKKPEPSRKKANTIAPVSRSKSPVKRANVEPFSNSTRKKTQEPPKEEPERKKEIKTESIKPTRTLARTSSPIREVKVVSAKLETVLAEPSSDLPLASTPIKPDVVATPKQEVKVKPATSTTRPVLSAKPLVVKKVEVVEQPPTIRKKPKKKSWLGISGYETIKAVNPETGDPMDLGDTEESGNNTVNMDIETPSMNEPLSNFYKKYCLPLHVIHLKDSSSSSSRYFLDLQLGLFFGHTSGRAFLDTVNIGTRVAVCAEKEELETCLASETIYSSMLFANPSTAKWIKWIPTRQGTSKGLKMTDLDVHFVKEEDVQSLIEGRMSSLRQEWLQIPDRDEGSFIHEIDLKRVGESRTSTVSSTELSAPAEAAVSSAAPVKNIVSPAKESTEPTGFYVHKLKRFHK